MRQCKRGWFWGALVVSLAVAGPAWAQQKQAPASVLPGRPDSHDGGQRAGDWFESKAAGIALRVPEGSSEVRRAGVPDLIAEFMQDKTSTMLRVSKLEFKSARQLADTKTIEGTKVPGILSDIVAEFQRENPAGEVLRNEATKINGHEAGLLAFRFSLGSNRRMLQQAIIQYTDTYYYRVTMTSPAGKPAKEGEIDSREKAAADLFSDIVDSVQLIDRTQIAKDQEDRLLRTKGLMENLRGPKVMNKGIVPEQWLRLTRDGKDIGYTYIVEERAKEDGRDGVLISVRSRTVADGQMDVASRMFISDFWKHESWTHVVTSERAKKSETISEVGMSDFEQKNRLDTSKAYGEASADDPKQPPVKKVTKYTLEVRRQIGKPTGKPNKPLTWDLPEWYLPQAVKHLLPRMLPLDTPQKYMFVTYVSEVHEPMVRYVDVGEAKEISFNGQKVKAVEVKDKVGLEGVPTTYYVTPEGKYLGSETVYQVGNTTSTIRVLPSDEATLRKIWDNAKLSKPEASEMPVMPDVLR